MKELCGQAANTVQSWGNNAVKQAAGTLKDTLAGNVVPELKRMPDSTTSSTVSVTISTRPERIAANRSPSGTRHTR